ncbi:MAG: hypothetical protein HOW73_37485 [Polyangiaceae bacterium]|nr:hypothetical protein [Polyangiaceae bacterium]
MRLTTRFVTTAFVSFCTAISASQAFAQAPGPERPSIGKTATLGWARLDGAESCIGTQELAQSVEKLLGRSVFVPASAAELAIEGRVEKKADGSGFRAVLSVSNKKGEALGSREIDGAGACSTINDPTSLAIALMIDPNAQLGAAPEPPPKEPPKEEPKPPAVSPPRTVYVPVRVPVPAPMPEKPVWSGDVALGFALGFGWQPGINPGAYGSASLKPPKFVPLEGSLTFFAPFDEEVPDDARVTFYSLYGAGYICPLEYTGKIGGVRACGGITGGFIVANPDGFDVEPKEESGIYGLIGASLRGRGTIRVYRLFQLGLGADMTVPFVRPDFTYRHRDGSSGRVFGPSPVLGALQAFTMLSFP